MNTQRTRLLRQSIDEEQRKLEEARKYVVMQKCADDNDMASCYESTHASISLMQRARERLQHLTQSMAAIEMQAHPVCLACGEEIPARRLAVVSDAVRCAACQEEWENRVVNLLFYEDAEEAPSYSYARG